jgi:hypothetical protein
MSTSGGNPQRLTTDEVAAVLRRAAELEAATAGIDAGLTFDATAVLEAAEEVGLSPNAVRHALAELQSGVLPAGPSEVRPRAEAGRLAEGPSAVVESRVVATPDSQVLATADEFFRRRSFVARRRQENWALYRARGGLQRHLRRVADGFTGSSRLIDVELVTVEISPIDDDRSLVRVAATLAPDRRGAAHLAGGYGVGALSGLIPLTAGEPALLLIGAPVGTLAVLGGYRLRRQWRTHRHQQVSETLAALLDQLGQPAVRPVRVTQRLSDAVTSLLDRI